MKKLYICIFVVFVFSSFTKDTKVTNTLSADINGNHYNFAGLKFIYFNPTSNATLFGAVIDTTLSPEYSIEITTFKKTPGTYSFGLYANVNLIRKARINNSDSTMTYYSTYGNLNITFFDTINQTIQGDFNCLATDYLSGDTINIKNGNFSISGSY